jgi:hypothetical protein
MPWAAGSYTKGNSGTGGWTGDASLGIGIEAGRHDTQDNDFATGINQCLNKDGSNAATGNLNLGGFKYTNAAAATARTDLPQVAQVQDGDFIWLGTTGGSAGTQTASASPPITAYKAGQKFRFISGFATSTAVTLNINSVGAANIVDNKTLEALNTVMAFNSGDLIEVVYDGTRFRWLNAATIARFTNDSVPNILYFYKSKGTSVGTNTLVASGDQLGQIQFLGAANTHYVPGAAIQVAVDGTPSAGSSDMPGRLVFSTTADGSGSPTERMRIDSAGQVGIGLAPASGVRLRVAGIGNTDSTNSLQCTQSGGSSTFLVTDFGLIQAPYVWNKTNAAAANMYIDSAGTFWRSTSSLKYKENVADLSYGLAKALQLRPVAFTSKNETSGRVYAGLIAEEVHDAGLTEFVVYNEENEPDAIHYGNMVALAFKAIQELNAKVEALQARVDELEAA